MSQECTVLFDALRIRKEFEPAAVHALKVWDGEDEGWGTLQDAFDALFGPNLVGDNEREIVICGETICGDRSNVEEVLAVLAPFTANDSEVYISEDTIGEPSWEQRYVFEVCQWVIYESYIEWDKVGVLPALEVKA